MKKFKKVLVLILAMAMVMTLFVGCNNNENTEPASNNEPNGENQSDNSDNNDNNVAQGPKVLRLAESKTATFNPHTYKTGAERRSMGYMFGTMVRLIMNEAGDGYELFPNHAKELPTMSEDGKTWTFKLREGLKFDDGTPINAETYEYTYKMLLDPKLVNDRATIFYDSVPVVNAKNYWSGEAKWEDVGIKVIDKQTLQFSLENPVPEIDFINVFTEPASSPVHKELYEANMNEDRTETKYGTSIDRMPKSSCGPYIMEEWIRDMSKTYNKNPNSPLADIYVPDRVEERVVENDETKLQLFESGEIDTVNLLGAKYDKYADDPRVKFAPAITSMLLILNKDSKDNPALADMDFRQALFYGMNRDSIAVDIYRTGKPANYILTSAYIADFETGQAYRKTKQGMSVAGNHGSYDPELAKKHFEKAYKANNNKKIVFEMNYFDSNENCKKISEFLEENYENLFGKDKIDVVLAAIPWQVQYENMEKGNFQSGYAFLSDDAFSPWSFMRMFTSNEPGKIDSFKNPEYDDLCTRSLTGNLIFDKEKRIQALADMENMVIDDFSLLPLVEINIPVMYSDRIQINTKDGMYIPGLSYAILQADIVDEQK
ncbi:peptide ABC transporter substrate-binding protein [Abyssisolibacter fermentans]|uniref:peptide ABC transporter substrate-binding protein n=1 Tax=Abyssisolibacter fermentans TaxID=1766203 RepID=UPI00082ABE3D|nr:peptide ABC transporter substrate-binding protein [Abyssisolibacter fermentans]